MDNCYIATKQLLKRLKVKHTNAYLKDNILSHPDHPSLLSIADTLTRYNIENLAVKITEEKFDELSTPCIVQVSVHSRTLFYTLTNITDTTVTYFDDKNKKQELTKAKFLKLWTGVCLMAETNATSKEIDIEKKLADKRLTTVLIGTSALLLTLWVVISFTKSDVFGNSTLTTYTVVYGLLKLVGLTAGVFLLWFDVDQYNPTLQSFCTGGKNINCNAVLKSKYASLFDGNLSLGLLGFSYFFATFTYLALFTFSSAAIGILAITSIITLPAIAISIYYQAAVIKQWCKFCIVIQVVLVAEVGIAFLGGFYKNTFAIELLPLYAALFLIPIVSWKLIKPLIEQQKETNVYKRGLKKIKANPFVLKSLLSKSDKVTHSTDGLGISITNKNAKYNVIKVCNPYCGPCAKAHPVLEHLVNVGSINLQVLFTATTNEKDRKAKPVRHFLAIDAHNKKEETQKALDQWYMAEKKDYDVFAKQYPMNGELEQQNDKIEDMKAWCKAENITHTPTLFINGYKLPKEYSIEDLSEVLI
ncbi:vitamin K epoxide reductase family protein [Aureibaculum conchae]|uniref:vitamin K epoxide reductase family protein n=1 Tax=Aureibaculum sp. 2308TA14-22 TaxID=3108392 RepID=UPI003390F748